MTNTEGADIVLIVEGPDDERRLQLLLPPEFLPSTVLIADGAQGVQSTCRALASGFDPPFLGVCDRDLMSLDEVEDLRRRFPHLFVWPSRCLENELLHPPLLWHTLEMTGHRDITEDRVRAVLREIADTQRPDVLARLVNQALYRRVQVTVEREDGDGPVDVMAKRYEAKRNRAQQQLRGFWTCVQEVEGELDARWDEDHLVMLDGKAALHQVAQRLTTSFKGPGLENALIRQALDAPPPGIAALRAAISERRR